MAVETTGFLHVSINCSDVVLSREFYGEQLGLTTELKTAPGPQDGAVFGLGDGIRWETRMMTSSLPPGTVPALELLEWRSPLPVGEPRPFNGLGMARMAYGTADPSGLHEKLATAGYEVLSRPLPVGATDDGELESFVAKDPDGQLVQFVPIPEGPLRPVMVNVNCTHVGASSLWYQLVLGIGVEHEGEVEGADGALLGHDGPLSYKEVVLRYGDDPRAGYMIDLVQWREPPPVGEAGGPANGLGIATIALGTPDVAAAYEELQRLEVECISPPQGVSHGAGAAAGEWKVVLFRDPDGTCLELIEVAAE